MMLAERKPLMWKGISEVGTEAIGHTVFAINACYRMMASKGFILAITLVILQIMNSRCQVTSNPCSIFDSSCSACISGGPDCVWCSDESFQTTKRPRCDLRGTMNSICSNRTDPISRSSEPPGNQPLGVKVQFSPQNVKLNLRVGQPAKFEIRVKPARNYPVDLYYLMDLSYSMLDDLQNLKDLGAGIASAIGKLTTDYRLAFGSFVDKTVSPFVDVSSERPCSTCRKTFGFVHNMNFTTDANEFSTGVRGQTISGNLDTPEGGFDGLMQLAVCEKKIGWRPKISSRRIVIFVTDAPPHSAGDGKLGGIVLPNDGKCHLDAQDIYSMTNELDYPSVGFLREKLKESKIVPILAVTSGVKTIFENVAKEWKDIGTTVGVLSSDSSNIVNLIRDNYKKISSTVRLVDSKPSDVKVEYKTKKCRSKTADNECSNVALEEEISFEVTVTPQRCSDAVKNMKSFDISIAGFGDIKVQTEVTCSCACESPPVATLNSTKCNYAGKFACGKCYCDPGRYGTDCICTDASAVDDSLCRANNATTGNVCSKAGTCICGTCECTPRQNPAEKITGTHCECRNFGCELHNGKECGGQDHGVCECNKCKCKGIWTGSNCGEKNCTLVQKDCVKDGVVCGGHGTCDCGECNCDVGYKGQHCGSCPSCPGQCALKRDCVLCQVFDRGDPGFCRNCSLNIIKSNATAVGRKCEVPDTDGCFIVFSYEVSDEGNTTIWVNPKKACPQTISSETNILAIVLGIIGGLLLAAIVALLLWKLLISTYDRIEYSKFEKERSKSNWNKAENPIYKGAKQKFDNPAYAGHRK